MKRAQELLSFMKEKGLIEEVKDEDIPEGYSRHPSSRYLKVSKKGRVFSRKYRELAEMIR